MVLRFDVFVISQWFKRCSYDSCLYIKESENGILTYHLLYVDDMLLVSKDIDYIRKIKDNLSLEFDMNDLGAVKRILRIDIKRDIYKGFLFLNHEVYIHKVLQRFNMHKWNTVSTPFVQHFKLSKSQCPSTE